MRRVGLGGDVILAPSRAARSAISSPMPREAPVMSNVLPLSVMGTSALVSRLVARR